MGCGSSREAVRGECHQLPLVPQPHPQRAPNMGAQMQPVQSDAAQDGTRSLETRRCLSSRDGMLDRYRLGEAIGAGSYGQVLAATLVADARQRRVVKQFQKEKTGHAGENLLFFNEVQLLKELSHENIALVYDVFEDANILYIVLELCEGEDVFSKLVETKRLRESEAENFMLATRSPPLVLKLIDFGFACKFDPNSSMKELCGSPHYLAPELIRGSYDCLVDIWAFGVLQFLLIHGYYPFNGNSPRDIIMEISSDPQQWYTQARVSVDCRDFLQGVLAVQVSLRFSAQQALDHVWMHMTDAETLGEENYRTWTHVEDTTPPGSVCVSQNNN